MQPRTTLAVVRCFRPVLLRLLDSYVQRRRSAVVAAVDADVHAATARDEAAAVALSLLLPLAPHLATCVLCPCAVPAITRVSQRARLFPSQL